MQAKNAILCGLSDTEFTKVMQCTTSKDVLDKIRRIYEGNDKAKKAKLQTLLAQFETLKKKEEEYISLYFLIVDEAVNSIIGIRFIIKENLVVQKIMRTLPTRFNSKVSILEDISDLDHLTKHKLYGILTTYEMRIEPKNESRNKSTF